jgi:hypothetical protein
MASLDVTLDVDFQDQRMLNNACDDVLGLQPLVGGPKSSPEEFFVGEIDVNEASRPHLGASRSSDALLLEDLDGDNRLLAAAEEADDSELLLGTSAPASLHNANWSSFPSIPEHAELHMIQQPSALQHTLNPTSISGQPTSSIQPTFIPIASGGLETYIQYNNSNHVHGTGLSGSPSSYNGDELDNGGLHLHFGSGNTFTMGQVGGRGGVPRVTSMPNLQLAGTSLAGNGGSNSNLHALAVRRAAAAAAAAGEGPIAVGPAVIATGVRTSTRMPRSRSANDVSGLGRYAAIPHSGFLTPPHLRKGKGGRQPAGDPRMDPRIDPKKAKRILANRLSAAKSKLKQKSAAEGLKQRVEMLRLQREGLTTEVSTLADACAQKEAEREALLRQLRVAEEALMHGKLTLGPNVNGMTQSHMAGLMV